MTISGVRTAVAALAVLALGTGCGTTLEGTPTVPTIAISDSAYSGLLALDTATGLLYSATSGRDPDDYRRDVHSLSIIDTSARTVRATIPLPSAASDLAVDTRSHTVYVVSALDRETDSGSITVVDGTAGKIVRELPVGKYAQRIAVDAATGTGYILSHSHKPVEDAKGMVYSSTLSILPYGADAVGPPLPATVGYARDVIFDPGSRTVAVADYNRVAVIDPAAAGPTVQHPLTRDTESLVFDPDSRTLFVVDEAGDAVMFDLAASRYLEALSGFGREKDSRGLGITHAAALDSAARILYIAANSSDDEDDTIMAIDTGSGAVVDTWQVPEPQSLVFEPGTNTLYVQSRGLVRAFAR